MRPWLAEQQVADLTALGATFDGEAVLQSRRGAAYAHVSLAVNARGERLAKRDGAVTLAQLAARGVRPAEVVSRIAESLGPAAPGEPVEVAELLVRFDARRLPREPWVVRVAA